MPTLKLGSRMREILMRDRIPRKLREAFEDARESLDELRRALYLEAYTDFGEESHQVEVLIGKLVDIKEVVAKEFSKEH